MRTLIVGAGKHMPKAEGFIQLDKLAFPNIDISHDLDVIPWPLQDGEFLHVSALHVIEHLKDLIAFMNEAWRILDIGGSLYIETPLAGGDPDLEFCDPTHVRCYRRHTFINYFTREGIEKFGYTDKPWAILECSDDGKILRFHGMPIK